MAANYFKFLDAPADAKGAATRDFTATHAAGSAPGALWLPATGTPKALILYGHGGSRHKRDRSVLDFVEPAIAHHNYAVACIDGPIHGARYNGPARTPPETQLAFRMKWESNDSGVSGMVADWRASLDGLLADRALNGVPVGYWGLSMGHAYGAPLLAMESRIKAAVIGLWGSNYPNSDQLVTAAMKVACPTLFFHKRTDEFFTLDGAVALFDAMPGDDKRFLLLPGPHAIVPEIIDTSLAFLSARLPAA